MPELYVDGKRLLPRIRLAREQRKLSRRKKGGKNAAQRKRKTARLNEHIAGQRKDFLASKAGGQPTNAARRASKT
jgi:transposase